MKTRRRRRKGLDEERKRQLKQDLKRHFLLSKKIATTENTSASNSEAASSSDNSQLSPEAELNQAQQFGHNFGDVSVFPEQTQDLSQSESQSEDTAAAEQESTTQQDIEAEDTNETYYSKLGLERLQDEEEARHQQLYAEQTQYLWDLPSALEASNQGHILKPFNEPFLVLEELLYMAEWENPGLDTIQHLWLVWGKWETYYAAWNSIVRDENRQLPGKGRESWSDRYQEKGSHELETTHLESTILRVMRREIAQKSAQEQEMTKVPTHHQLHCYFLDLRRQDWDATSWQRPTPNGADWQQEDDDEELNSGYSSEE